MMSIEAEKSFKGRSLSTRIFYIIPVIYFLLLVGAAFFLMRAATQDRVELTSVEQFENPAGFLKFRLDDTQTFLTRAAVSQPLFISLENNQQAGFPPIAGTLTSAWFTPSAYISVPVVGPSYLREKGPSAGFDVADASITLECRATSGRLPLLNAFNSFWYEKVIAVPRGWCPGDVRLVAEVRQVGTIIGVGAPAQVGRLFYLAATKLGYLAWGLVGSAFVALLFAPFLVVGWFTPLQRLGMSLTYGGLYLLATASVGSSVLASIAAVGLLLPGLAVLVLAPKLKLELDLLAKWTFAFVAAAALLALVVASLPLVGGPWFSNDVFYPVTWSTDNHLPALMAKYVLVHGAGHPPALGLWSVTDRGFGPAGLLVGVISLLRFVGLYEGIPNTYIPIYLVGYFVQACAISFLFVLSASPNDNKLSSILKILFLLTVPMIFFNLVYTWVKILSGVSFIVAAFLGASAVRSGSIVSIFLAFMCITVSLISHAASLLASPLVALFIGYVVIAEGKLPGLLKGRWNFRVVAACVGAGLISATLLFFHDNVAAKTTYGAIFVLTGTQHIGLDPGQAKDVILQYYKDMTILSFFESKWINFLNIFWPVGAQIYYVSCGTHGLLSCLRAAQFVSVGPALGLSVIGLCLVGLFGAKAHDVIQRDIRAFACGSAIWMGVMLVAFGVPFIVIVLPYALLMSLVLLALVNLNQAGTAIAVPLLLLQVVNIGWVWIVGARGVWAKFGF